MAKVWKVRIAWFNGPGHKDFYVVAPTDSSYDNIVELARVRALDEAETMHEWEREAWKSRAKNNQIFSVNYMFPAIVDPEAAK